MKPIIGVTSDFNAGDRQDMGGREPTYFLRALYPRAIEDLGGIPLILPLAADRVSRRQMLKNVDGLLVTGSGPDLSPELYGQRQRYRFPVMSHRRANFELEMVRLAATAGVPILGICGGMQAINVALGGSLIQDIASQVPSALPHRQAAPARRLSHTVQVSPRSLLRRITREASFKVNSSHHQSIKRVATSLVPSAFASDGIIEAVESRRHSFLLGVQWHPEFLYERDTMARRLFLAFLRACRRNPK
ncbi:MAG: gamma-glutamyl-gamma-aminobutyrate hydrolase family protein [Nitrospiraceae bacterium]